MRKSRQKTLIFRNWISFEPEGVETSNNYVWTAFSQPHKRGWGAKAVRRDLQLQKSRGSRPNFDFFENGVFFIFWGAQHSILTKDPIFFHGMTVNLCIFIFSNISYVAIFLLLGLFRCLKSKKSLFFRRSRNFILFCSTNCLALVTYRFFWT